MYHAHVGAQYAVCLPYAVITVILNAVETFSLIQQKAEAPSGHCVSIIGP
jgi:hypothetical protein